MKKSKFSEEQIAYALREVESGRPPADVRRQLGRELAAWVLDTFGVSRVRACHLAQFSRAAWYRRSTRDDPAPLRARIRALAHARPRFGYMRVRALLRREGWPVNSGCDGASTSPCIAAPRRWRPAPASAGAWTSSMTR